LVETAGATHQVVAAVTRPDQPRSRGMRLEASEVGAAAAQLGLPVLKPVRIRTAEFSAQLEAYRPDLLVVAAYGRILPASVLATARMMPINVHASLLPRHRGAAPIEHAILEGDSETGVTIMRVVEKLDAGPILLTRAIPIDPTDTQASLKLKLADLGAQAAIDAIAGLAGGTIVETPQDEALATYASPVTKDDALIDWRADAVRIERMSRAYDPWPIARTSLRGEPLLIFRASVIDREDSAAEELAGAHPGTIVALDPRPVVQCGAGRLALIEVQAPGRKRMAAADFARGRRIEIGERLGG
jgi:methionyl-tRNA formyltransferase